MIKELKKDFYAFLSGWELGFLEEIINTKEDEGVTRYKMLIEIIRYDSINFDDLYIVMKEIDFEFDAICKLEDFILELESAGFLQEDDCTADYVISYEFERFYDAVKKLKNYSRIELEAENFSKKSIKIIENF